MAIDAAEVITDATLLLVGDGPSGRIRGDVGAGGTVVCTGHDPALSRPPRTARRDGCPSCSRVGARPSITRRWKLPSTSPRGRAVVAPDVAQIAARIDDGTEAMLVAPGGTQGARRHAAPAPLDPRSQCALAPTHTWWPRRAGHGTPPPPGARPTPAARSTPAGTRTRQRHGGVTPCHNRRGRVSPWGTSSTATTPAAAWDEMFEAAGEPRPHYRSSTTCCRRCPTPTSRSAATPATAASATRASRSRSRARSGRSRSTSCPGSSRPTSGRSIERGVAPAGAGARGVPRRRLRRRARSSTTASCPAGWSSVVDPLPPRRGRHRAAATACASTSPASTSSATRAGRFRVLEDNLRTPSGISYVIENRRAMTHVFPELFASHRVRRSPTTRRTCSRRCGPTAPRAVDDPTVVVLTPGRAQRRLLRALVPGPPDGRRAGRGPRPRVPRQRRVRCAPPTASERVDVVYRRIDDDFLDPLHFRARLGRSAAPASLNAARAGNVTIANAVGNGVADDKAVYPYVPDDDPRTTSARSRSSPNVETYRPRGPRRAARGCSTGSTSSW